MCKLKLCWELRKGADTRVNAFRKFLLSGQDAGALDAVLRFRKIKEETDRDSGRYVSFDKVLAHFNNDQSQALEFCRRREQEIRTEIGQVSRPTCGLRSRRGSGKPEPSILAFLVF